MAVTDIVNFAGEPLQYDMSRGNSGVPTDLQGAGFTSTEIPAAESSGGGNIFIMSE